MSITTTIGTLVDASPAFRRLAVQELPVKTAYRLSRIIKKAEEHLSFYEEQYTAALEKHCEQRGDEGRWFPKTAEDRAEFERRLAELRLVDAELENVSPCVIADGEGVKITCADMIALEAFVEFEIEEEEEK